VCPRDPTHFVDGICDRFNLTPCCIVAAVGTVQGAKRSTSFAAQTAGQRAAEVAAGKGVERVRVLLKGLGPGRSTAVKGLKLGGLGIVEITDRTPEPHNGCRPRKARRL
jgi:small subunit ribosomal protein S11